VPWLLACPRPKWEKWSLAGLTLLVAVILLPALERVPRVFMDECWAEAMAGYTLAFEGRPRNPGLMGWGGVNEYFLQPRLFSAVIVAPVYRLAGYGLAQSRATSAVFGFLFIFGVYGVMRRLFGPAAATAVSVMTAVDPWFFLTGRQFRPEIFLAANLWWSLYFLLGALRHESGWRALVSGVLLGLAAWTHPNSMVFGAASVLAAMVLVGPRRRWLRTLPHLTVGGMLGLLPYVAYVLYVQSVSDVRLLDQLHPGRLSPYARPIAEMLTTEWQRWSAFLRFPLRAPLLVLYLIAVVAAALRRQRADLFVLLSILLAGAFLPLVVGVPWPRYLLVLLPALAALVWRALPWQPGIEAVKGAAPGRAPAVRSRAAMAGLGVAVFAAMTAAPTAALAWKHRTADFAAFVRPIARLIPPDARVMANIMFWSELHNRPFIASFPPDFGFDWEDEQAAAAHIRRYRPEYLIQESQLFSTSGGLGPQSRDLRAVPFGRACEIVAGEMPAENLGEFEDYHYGAIRVWRFYWPEPATSSAPTPQR